MNIPEVKTDVKPPARAANETKSVQHDAQVSAEHNAVQGHQAIDKIEKTSEDTRHKESNLTKEKAEQVARKVESELAAKNHKLKFNVIEESNTIQVEIKDSEDKVIKKIPADDIVKLTKSIRQHFQGSLLDKTY